jgi:hypothetical protein
MAYMSEFYTRITGNDWETESTRCGHKTLGAEAQVKDWETTISVRVWREEETDENYVFIHARGGKSDEEARKSKVQTIYHGPLSKVKPHFLSLYDKEPSSTFPEALDEVLMEEFGELGLNLAQNIRERCGANKTA